ncbi:host attachment protein [Roseovarius sp. A21]|uniref:Host attachment protein n=1 Tax=Roseovarius bejariae TaxID=2576383 RepID=A0A844D3G3_9RHOB|nr:host attachment family protein [Roseovarius bejariae]MRU16393.1 host attachment protein [Roseovarius bejariae]
MPVLTNGTWVLIADGEKALFLRNTLDAINPGFEVVKKEEQDNPSDFEQSANRPGRMHDGAEHQLSAMDDTDWHELAKERFADDLADKLYAYAHKGAFDRIVLVASSRVLGQLRKTLHKEVETRIVGELAKDLTNHPLDKVETMLKKEFDPNL